MSEDNNVVENLKAAQYELALKDKEIALLVKHCDTLVQQSNTLKLLNDFDYILDENKHLYDHIDTLNNKHHDELIDFTKNMEEMNSVNDKEQEHLNKLLVCKNDEIAILNDRCVKNKQYIQEQNELITKQNDELIDLNFVIYNQNKELYDLQYLKEREEDIEDLKKQYDELKVLNNHYVNLIEEIKTFIDNTQKSQYIPLFNPTRIVDNLMILFNEKILCHDNIQDAGQDRLEVPKGKKMKKRLSNRS